MGLMDLFRRNVGKSHNNETRAAQPGYTAALMAAREGWLSGGSGLGEITATVQTCVTLWESLLSMADVSGADLLDRASMAMAARALALRGEAVFLIRDRLVPATDWDISTRYGQPRAYRVGLPEIGGGRNETVLAGEVLHFRIGVDPVTPWAGSAPLARAKLTAGLLEAVEVALRDVFTDAPIGSQIIPVPEGSAGDMEAMRRSFRGRRGASLVIEGVAQATAAGMNPNVGKSPDQLSPDLQRTLADKLMVQAQGGIYVAYGILPGLTNPATTGPMVHRANADRWRQANYLVQVMVVLMNHARLIFFSKERARQPGKGHPVVQAGRCCWLGDELGQALGGDVQAVIDDAAQQSQELAGSLMSPGGAFDPSLPAIELLANTLVYQYAKSLTGERLTNEAVNSWRQVMGIGNLLSNQADSIARLQQAVAMLDARDARLRASLGNTSIPQTLGTAPAVPGAQAATPAAGDDASLFQKYGLQP